MSRRTLTSVLAVAVATVALTAPIHADASTIHAPSAPRSPTASAGNARATIHWLAPTSTGGAAITSFVVRRATAATGPWTTASTVAASRRSATLAGLVNGTAYYLDVLAKNSRGSSAASKPVKVVPFAAPGAPPSLTATPGDGAVELGWGAAAASGAPVTTYIVKRLADTTWTTVGATQDRTFTATGLTNASAYSFRVLAQNKAGTGPASGIVTSTPRTHPDAPLALTATPRDGGVRLDWQAPSDNGSAITGYAVQQLVGDTWADLATVSGTTFTQHGLTNGTTYSFRVIATNDAGTGAPASATAAPLALATAPVITDASVFMGYLYLDWAQPGEAGSQITHWSVERYVDGGWTHLADMTRAQHEVVVSATYGDSFTLRLFAVNASGMGAASGQVVLQDSEPPAQPTLDGTSQASGVLDLTWNIPTAQGDPPINSSTVDVSPVAACTNGSDPSRSCYASQNLAGGSRASQVTGLVSGVQYAVTVHVCTNTVDLEGGQTHYGQQCRTDERNLTTL